MIKLHRSPHHWLAFAVAMLLLSADLAAAIDPDTPIRQLRRQNWFLEQGLPQAAATSIAQDKNGFVWVGTQDGLTRFDGRSFLTYRQDDHPGLANNAITQLQFDSHGRLWIGTKNGLSVMDGERVSQFEAFDGQTVGTISAVAIDEEGIVWVASEGGLKKVFDGKLQSAEILGDQPTYGVLTDEDLRVVSASGGLQFGQDWLPAPDPAIAMKQAVLGCDGPWVASSHGLFQVVDNQLQRFAAIPERGINTLHCDQEQVLWVGEGRGLWRIKAGKLIDSVTDESQFPHLWVMALATDREGGIWVGTISGGLYRLSTPGYVRINQLEGLPFKTVWAVANALDGGVWVAGDRSVVKINDGVISPEIAPDQLADSVIMTVFEDRQTGLWVGTRSGLFRIDDAGRSTRIHNQGTASVFRNSSGDLLAGTLSGVLAIDGDATSALQTEGPAVTRIRTMAETEGSLLVGSSIGAYQLRNGAFEQLGIEPAKGAPAAALAAHQGRTYIGYLGSGLAVGSNDQWRLLGRADGLIADTVYHLDFSQPGWLWASSNRGVFRVELEQLDPSATGSVQIEPLITITGLEPGAAQGYCCNGGSSGSGARDAKGNLWLPSLDGVVRIAQQPNREQLPSATVEIESVAFSGRTLSVRGIDQVTMPIRERDLLVSFTAPTFVRPQATGYRYRLVGYENTWRRSDFGQANYTNLPAGDYTLEVSASGSEAVVSRLNITIPKLPREQSWVHILAAMGLALILYAAYRLRLRRLKTRERELSEQVSLRTAELQTANQQLERLAMQDPLTRAGNRNYLHGRIEDDIREALRDSGEPDHQGVAFVLIDLDHFKNINDEHGHAAGDLALNAVAERLRDMARSDDYLIRWGGEEFLWVAPNCGPADAEQLAERIVRGVGGQPIVIHKRSMPISCSAGFSVFPAGLDDARPEQWPRVVELADFAMYEVKKAGRNGWAGLLVDTNSGDMADFVRNAKQHRAKGMLRMIGPTTLKLT